MGENIALKGSELKRLLKVAEKRPIAFAYCPGNKVTEDIFSMDYKKNPEAVARAVRKEADSIRLAFGVISVEGKVISLQCERQLPKMSEKLTKFLRAEKCPMNVVILNERREMIRKRIRS